MPIRSTDQPNADECHFASYVNKRMLFFYSLMKLKLKLLKLKKKHTKIATTQPKLQLRGTEPTPTHCEIYTHCNTYTR